MLDWLRSQTQPSSGQTVGFFLKKKLRMIRAAGSNRARRKCAKSVFFLKKKTSRHFFPKKKLLKVFFLKKKSKTTPEHFFLKKKAPKVFFLKKNVPTPMLRSNVTEFFFKKKMVGFFFHCNKVQGSSVRGNPARPSASLATEICGVGQLWRATRTHPRNRNPKSPWQHINHASEKKFQRRKGKIGRAHV